MTYCGLKLDKNVVCKQIYDYKMGENRKNPWLLLLGTQ